MEDMDDMFSQEIKSQVKQEKQVIDILHWVELCLNFL